MFPPDCKIPPHKRKVLCNLFGYGAMAANLSVYAMQAVIVLFVDDPLVLLTLLAFVVCRYEQTVFMGGSVLESIERELCPLHLSSRIGKILLPGYAQWDEESNLINVGRLVATMGCIIIKLCAICIYTAWKDGHLRSGAYGIGYVILRALRDKCFPEDRD